jgi:hypothetical protein
MEYVEGEILKRPVAVADVLRLAGQIARALAAAITSARVGILPGAPVRFATAQGIAPSVAFID